MDIYPPIKTPEKAAERSAELYGKYNTAVGVFNDARRAADDHPDGYDGYVADDSTPEELYNLHYSANVAGLRLENVRAANKEFFEKHCGLLVEAALAEARAAGKTINY